LITPDVAKAFSNVNCVFYLVLVVHDFKENHT